MDRPIELTAESLWNEVAGRLKGALNETTYRTWFAEAEGAELSDDTFILGVPNDFTREWIEGHFLGLIGAAVRDVTGQERRVALSVTERVPIDTPIPAEALPRQAAAGFGEPCLVRRFVEGSFEPTRDFGPQIFRSQLD